MGVVYLAGHKAKTKVRGENKEGVTGECGTTTDARLRRLEGGGGASHSNKEKEVGCADEGWGASGRPRQNMKEIKQFVEGFSRSN